MKKFEPIINNFNKILHGGDYNPEQWLDFPDVIEQDFSFFDKLNCNTFSIGIFSWTSYEKIEGHFDFSWLEDMMDKMDKAGKKVFLATPSGAPPAWMSKKYPEILRLDLAKERSAHSNRHNFCWSSPIYREKVSIINHLLAQKFANHPALAAWHISNEYQGECFCELCIEKFRVYLKEKYGTIENLNRAYWSNFWNRTFVDWADINPHYLSLDGLALDWKRFSNWQLCDFMKFEVDTIKKYSNAITVTNMMGFHENINYYRVADISDVVADDSYPGWLNINDYAEVAANIAMTHDAHRAMKKKPFFIMESTPSSLNWMPYARLKRPGLHRLEGLLAVGHGADGVLYFQMRKGRGGHEKFHGAVIDHASSENTRVFQDVKEMGEIYKQIGEIRGSYTKAEVAVIFDWDSNFALGVSSGPSNKNKKIIETVQKHYRALWELNIPIDVIESRADFSQYKVIVAPMLFMLNNSVANEIKKFVANGGIFISTYLSFYVNENNLHFTGGLPGDGLREVFGIWNEEFDGLTPEDEQSYKFVDNSYFKLKNSYKIFDYAERIHLESAEALAVYGNDFYADEAALSVNKYQNGYAYYQAARSDLSFLIDFYQQIALKHEIKQLIPKQNDIHATIREVDDERYLFIYNFSTEAKTIDLGENKGISLINNKLINQSINLLGLGSDVIKLKLLLKDRK